MNNKILIR